MAKRLQIRGGTSEQHNTFTGASREITIDTSKNTVVVHDGYTPGGFPLAKESSVNTRLASKVDYTEIASVNLLRADKYLAAQNVTKMIYDANKKLTKVQYNNATDVDYEVLSYTDGKLTNVAHYVGSVLKGNTVLTYVSGSLDSAPFVAV